MFGGAKRFVAVCFWRVLCDLGVRLAVFVSLGIFLVCVGVFVEVLILLNFCVVVMLLFLWWSM